MRAERKGEMEKNTHMLGTQHTRTCTKHTHTHMVSASSLTAFLLAAFFSFLSRSTLQWQTTQHNTQALCKQQPAGNGVSDIHAHAHTRTHTRTHTHTHTRSLPRENSVGAWPQAMLTHFSAMDSPASSFLLRTRDTRSDAFCSNPERFLKNQKQQNQKQTHTHHRK